jgi:hypothetical protein
VIQAQCDHQVIDARVQPLAPANIKSEMSRYCASAGSALFEGTVTKNVRKIRLLTTIENIGEACKPFGIASSGKLVNALSACAGPFGDTPIVFSTALSEHEARAPEFVMGQGWIKVLQPSRLRNLAFADQREKEICPFDGIRVGRPVVDHRYLDQVHQKRVGAIGTTLMQGADGETEFGFRQIGHIIQAACVAVLGLFHLALFEKQIALLQ